MKKVYLVILISMFALWAPLAEAQNASDSGKGKIFLTTSTYGVMAGSLVGLASLTFYRQPSKKLRNVAIGASLGLYTGILLGAYMIYFVPDPTKPRTNEAAPQPTPAPSLDSDDPLQLGTGDEQGRWVEPNFLPVALFDGDAVVVGLDFKF